MLHGWVRAVDAKVLRLYTSDARTVEIQLSDKTKKPEKAVMAGDYVDVEVAQDDKGQYLAASVKKTDPPKGEKAPRAELPIEATENKPEGGAAAPSAEKKVEAAKQVEPAPEAAPEPPATIVKPKVESSDADAPPKLKRGIPARKKSAAADDEVEVASTSAAAAPPAPGEEVRVIESTGEVRRVSGPEADSKMELLGQARNQSINFLEGLPNYMCKQFTTRYQGGGKPVNWRAMDVVSADLVYEDGRERYQNLAVNGKTVKGKMEDTGSWSTGEFGTVLKDLFSPSTAAAFHYAGTMPVQRRQATQYDFSVDQEGVALAYRRDGTICGAGIQGLAVGGQRDGVGYCGSRCRHAKSPRIFRWTRPRWRSTTILSRWVARRNSCCR